MPNKDWYWDRFETTVKQGELDLSDAQTAALVDNERFTDTQANNYETRFIDELYGTDERAWAGEKAPYDDGTDPVFDWNFGNPPYANSSSAADANGYGDFEYAPPAGYYALCTKNLAEFGG